MTRSVANRFVRWWTLILCTLGGCTYISVDPECPDELEVGASGSVWANEKNPGAIPIYQWEAVPSDAGTFADATVPNTDFTAAKEGAVVIRLMASDGLFRFLGECHLTVVAPGDVAVSLTVDPDPPIVGEEAILFCSSVGEAEAVTRGVEQVEGPSVTLSVLSEGVATFSPTEVGELTFSCTGETASGRPSEASVVTVSVVMPPDDTGDGDDRPSRPGRE